MSKKEIMLGDIETTPSYDYYIEHSGAVKALLPNDFLGIRYYSSENFVRNFSDDDSVGDDNGAGGDKGEK
ncbi:MAG: hypothetical protein HQK53_19200 [Oligoflexia bacterium]|nr:hypothetical protein [Oligoflexia bacterium]